MKPVLETLTDALKGLQPKAPKVYEDVRPGSRATGRCAHYPGVVQRWRSPDGALHRDRKTAVRAGDSPPQLVTLTSGAAR